MCQNFNNIPSQDAEQTEKQYNRHIFEIFEHMHMRMQTSKWRQREAYTVAWGNISSAVENIWQHLLNPPRKTLKIWQDER